MMMLTDYPMNEQSPTRRLILAGKGKPGSVRGEMVRLSATARAKRENTSQADSEPLRLPVRSVPADSAVLGNLTINARVMRVETSADERAEAERKVLELMR